jgi:hypothetical protein
MRRFQKKPDVTFAFIPGVGRVGAEQVLEGEQYARFVPSLLVELPALSTPAPAASAPVAPSPKVTPVVVVPPPAPSSAPKTAAEVGLVPPEAQADGERADVAPADSPKEDLKKEDPKPKPSASKKPPGRK